MGRVYTDQMSVTESTKVGPKGRVVIPQRFRDELGIAEGDELIFVTGARGVLSVLTREQLVAELDGSWQDNDLSLVDELFADRRAEAARDR